jgi:hypothetical protein
VNKIGQAKTLVNCVRNDFIHKKSNSQVIDERVYLGEVPAPYQENLEMTHVNMAKIRLETGEPFEWPNIVALNWAVTSLIGKAKRIVEIGVCICRSFADYFLSGRRRFCARKSHRFKVQTKHPLL